jgi:hypothetical protein
MLYIDAMPMHVKQISTGKAVKHRSRSAQTPPAFDEAAISRRPVIGFRPRVPKFKTFDPLVVTKIVGTLSTARETWAGGTVDWGL